MSAGDNIFARWSRRKQAVRDRETTPDAQEPGAEAAPEAEARPAEPVGRQSTAEPDVVEAEAAEAADPAEPLPRLEDLTAESDLSAFLRKGVPEALKSAAMRKMWSLDPAIRDYIGPSEYAWDFNQPGSMAGFGPLDANDTMVADFLSTMSGGARAGLAKTITAPDPETPPQQQIVAASPGDEANASSDGPADADAPEESPEHPPAPAKPRCHSLDRVAAAGELVEPEEPAGPSRIAAAPRHGRAMPR